MVFTSLRNGEDAEAYGEAAERMMALAQQQPRAQLALDLGNADRQAGLRNPDPLCPRSKAAGIDHGAEHAHGF